jgi:murein DD-endopeptidase MepM/ murein hydrolase activator NlpD
MLNKTLLVFSTLLYTSLSFSQDNIAVDFTKNPINTLTNYLIGEKNMLPYYPSLFPFNSQFTISSDFGERIHPISGKNQFHSGIDFTCPNGTPVFTAAHGRVLKVIYNDKIVGNSVTISHLNNWTTSFSHLKRIDVVADQLLSRFDVIGITGDTGNVTGNHLHYTIMHNDKPVDPLPLCYLYKYINEL